MNALHVPSAVITAWFRAIEAIRTSRGAMLVLAVIGVVLVTYLLWHLGGPGHAAADPASSWGDGRVLAIAADAPRSSFGPGASACETELRRCRASRPNHEPFRVSRFGAEFPEEADLCSGPTRESTVATVVGNGSGGSVTAAVHSAVAYRYRSRHAAASCTELGASAVARCGGAAGSVYGLIWPGQSAR